MTDGDRAWIVLAAGVIAYDSWALANKKETMSASFLRALDDPRRRHLTTGFWAYLVAHLFGIIPTRLDPLRRWFG